MGAALHTAPFQPSFDDGLRGATEMGRKRSCLEDRSRTPHCARTIRLYWRTFWHASNNLIRYF